MDILEELPKPPDFLTLIPEVRVSTSSIPLERPLNLAPSTTVTAIGLLRI